VNQPAAAVVQQIQAAVANRHVRLIQAAVANPAVQQLQAADAKQAAASHVASL